MMLYTVIFEFKSGSYVNQFHAEGPLSACKSFIQELDVSIVSGMETNHLSEILTYLDDGDHNPVLLEGLKNVWYTSVIVDDHMAEFNIVLTVM